MLRGPALLWAGPLVFLALFYAWPLAGIVATSFAREADGLLRALGSPATGRVLLFTLGQAAASTALTLAVGLPGAFLVARYRFAGNTLFRALTDIPFVLPTLVVAAAFDALLGARGWGNAALEAAGLPPLPFTRTLGAILVAHVFYNTTIVLRLVGDYWSRIDRRLWDAARTLGAGAAQRWLRISLPLLAAPVAAAAVLVFIFCFTSFGVILILGGPRFATIEVEIYYQAISLFDLPVAASLALVQVAITLALGIAYTRLMRRVSRPLPLRAPRTNERSLTGRPGRAL
ncbi:MAG: ABC transporter permease subunit, partial [Spirochaetaceae bacterium]|nr:ABC transporter permease subunit [Spirochaetaceae bacterium]